MSRLKLSGLQAFFCIFFNAALCFAQTPTPPPVSSQNASESPSQMTHSTPPSATPPDSTPPAAPAEPRAEEHHAADDLIPKPVPIPVQSPTPVYPGWAVQFQHDVFSPGVEDELVREYQRRVGVFLYHEHVLNLSENRGDAIIFNPYTGSYINIRDEQKAYTVYMTRKLTDTSVKTILRKPELKQVRQSVETVEKATHVRVELTPPEPEKKQKPRVMSAKDDYVADRVESYYDGPEGNLSLTNQGVLTFNPLLRYTYLFLERNTVSVFFNLGPNSYGASLGRTLTSFIGVSANFTGGIPRDPEPREYRGTIDFAWTF